MNPVVVEAPSVVQFSEGHMERDARLLVAGDYPGKNLKVTEADIDALVANFSGPIPVKVEHINTPLDPLGLVERVWRDGSALLGRIKFPAEMAAFLSKRDAHKLSVGLLKEPTWKLLEASLTLTPHIPTATLLSGDPSVAASRATSPSGRGQEVGATLLSDGEKAELVMLRDESSALRQQVRKQTVDAQIAELKASGRVVPATEALARALLSAPESAVVTLSEGFPAVPYAEAFRQFLAALPPLVQFGEVAAVAPGGRVTLNAPASGAAAFTANSFTEEEQELLRRLGVSPEDVSKTMEADKAQKGGA